MTGWRRAALGAWTATLGACGGAPPVAVGEYIAGTGEVRGVGGQIAVQDGVEWRRQVVRHLGEQHRGLPPRDGAAARVARYLKDPRWKKDKHQGPEGWRHQAKVLAFVPRAEFAAAARAVGDTLQPRRQP